MNLTKLKNGSYIPTYDSDKELSNKIAVGEEVYASKKRNIDFHRKSFALLKLGFENQDKYEDFEIYRQVITMKAGFVHFITGVDGKEYPLPKSLAFDKMNAEEFEKWYAGILHVISKEARINKTDIENELENFY